MNKWGVIIMISIIGILGFGKVSASSKGNQFVKEGKPAEVSVDEKVLNTLVSDIKNNKIQNIHSVIIIKDDMMIFEEYFNGFDREKLQYSASVSKSFTSTLLGIAIDKGFFGDDIQSVLNKKIIDLFPEFGNIIKKDSLKSELKLKHILSMTAGFEWDEHSHPYSSNQNDCHIIERHQNPLEFLFEKKLIHQPGKEFYYNGGLSLSISYLIEKYTKMKVDKFAEKYLFEPLGIKDYHWEKVANGMINTDGGLHLTPIDQAKLGYLFLNKGVWKNSQIISEKWIVESTKIQKENIGMPSYGYQWWCGDFYSAEQKHFIYFASGHGGQKIIVSPKLNTVIVITQKVFDNPYNDINFLAIVSDYIFPAIGGKSIEEKIISMSSDELGKYTGEYISNITKEKINVRIKDDHLLFISGNGQEFAFHSVGNNVFTSRLHELVNMNIHFETKPENIINAINFTFAFKNETFSKVE